MLVKEVMVTNVRTIRPEDTVKDAVKIMNEDLIGSLMVVSGSGEVVGIVTERDVLRDVVATEKNPSDVKVRDIMTRKVIAVAPNNTLEEAADIMTKNKVKKLPVIFEGRIVGIVTATDLIAYEKSLIEKVSHLLVSSPMKGIGG